MSFSSLAQSIPGIENESGASGTQEVQEIVPNVQSRLVVDGELKSFFQWVYYQGPNQELYIEKDKLIKNLLGMIKDKFYYQLKKLDGKFITRTQLKQFNIDTMFNESTLDIEMKIPAKLKQDQTVNLVGRGFDQYEKDYVIRSNKFSTYINVNMAQEFSDAGDTSYQRTQSQTNLEMVNYLYGVTVQNVVDYNSTQEEKWQRTRTLFSYDFEKQMTRLQVGDINKLTIGRQRQFLSGGVSYSRLFSINPRFLRTNITTNQIILERPSRVEIYVNDRLVTTRDLQAGPVDIRDFPFFSGQNRVLLRITDDLGRIREEYFDDFFSPQLLRKGISEFDISVEVPRNQDPAESEYDTDNPYFSAFYRYGLSKRLAAALYTQMNQDEQLLGSEVDWINRYATTSAEVAFSRNSADETTGVFAGIDLSTLLFRMGELSPYALTTSLQYRSEDFYPQSLDNLTPNNTRYILDMNVRQNGRASLQSSFGFRKLYNNDADHKTIYYIDSAWNVTRNLQVSMRASSSFSPEEETQVILSLFWYDRSGKHQVFSNFNPERRAASARYQYNPLNRINDIRATVGTNVEPATYTLDGSLEYYHRRFLAGISHSASFLRNADSELIEGQEVTNTTRVNAGFALAFAGSAMAISQPIQNGFIIINTDKKVNTDKIYINRTIDVAQAQIDDFGPAVLNNVPAYINESITVDNSTLPIGVSLGQEHYIARTGFKSGIHIEAKVTGFAAVKGKLLYPNNFPVKLEVGSVIKINPDLSRSEVGRFFTNSDGEFFIEKLLPGDYKIELDNTDVAAVPFNLKKNQIGVIELGTIKLETSKRILE